MRKQKKLYRSIAASLLMLFAGLVLAPTLVTAQFQATTKKPAAPAPQVAQVTPAPAAPTTPQREPRPAAPIPHSYDEQSVPQAETEPTADSAGPTTFAVADFEPIHEGGAAFAASDFGPIHGGGAASPRGGAGVNVATADTGSNIAKVMGKPNSPTDDTQTDNQQSDNNSAPSNSKPTGSTGSTGSTGEDAKHDHPAGDDKHDHSATDDQHDDDDLRLELPLETQLADNGDDLPQTSVPEPSSIALLLAGVLGLVVARRRG